MARLKKTRPEVKTGASEVKTTSLAAFASQLRAWRSHSGLTQVELASKVGYSASLISGVESMDKPPTAEFAKALDRVFTTPGFDEEPEAGTFIVLQQLVAREAYPAFFAPVVSLERGATRIHGWELGAIPGLLQTEDYARELIRVSRPNDSDERIGKLVAGRIQRQEILSGEAAPMLWYVIDESILRHVVGSPKIMAAQLDRLIEASAIPGIVVQVLPFTADHAGTDGSISIYEFPDAPAACFTECFSGGRIVEEGVEVGELVTVVNMLRASALSPRDSLELIRQIRSEIDERSTELA